MKRLLIDDVRVDDSIGMRMTMICRDYDSAIVALANCSWDEIYIDHDLGLGKTGYDVMVWIEEKIHYDKTNDSIFPNLTAFHLPERIVCVSNNPSGRQRIEMVVRKIYEE